MADNLVPTGQIAASSQIMELPDQLSDPDQAILACYRPCLARLPRDVALDILEDLPTLTVDPKEPRSARPPSPLEQLQKTVHKLSPRRNRPPDRITQTDDRIHETPGSRSSFTAPACPSQRFCLCS